MSTAQFGGYTFHVCNINGDWNAVGGLYVFACQAVGFLSSAQWRPLYVGQTHSFADRLPTHECWSAAEQMGATHVLALVEEDLLERARLEKAMIESYQPPLNVQLK